MSAPRAVILGCPGPALTSRERKVYVEADPWGFILFARNVESPDQLRRLTADLRDAVGRDAPVLIDQEGGRVARLRPPHWRAWPDVPAFCARFAAEDRLREALRLRYRAIAAELTAIGVDVNCAPMADVAQPGADPIVASRALGGDPALVAGRARAVAEGLIAGGVLPVIKHMPGHGRATADSHAALPVVDAPLADLDAVDFAAFRPLADLPLGMTAHVVFAALDPDRPATLSPAAIAAIRDRIGFGGALISDDLGMGALSGPISDRVAAALAAGCDLALHCNGEIDDFAASAAAAPRLEGAALARAEAALTARPAADAMTAEEAAERLDHMMREAAHA